MLKSFFSRVLGAIGYFLFLMMVGTVGYSVVEGWPLRDAVFMTAITISAVGYDEVRPLTQAGRTFTMVLIFMGITGIGIYLGLLTSFIVEFDLRSTIQRKKRMKTIEQLDKHVVVCGAGRTGRRLVTDLIEANRSFVVIDINPDRIALLLEDHPGAAWLEGDATHDSTLEEAGLSRASGLVATLSSDADNVYVCLSARSLNADLTIVARAYEDETIDKLYRAGASHVVSPNITGALRMASVLLRPSVVSFLDVAIRSREVALRLEQATVAPASPLDRVTLKRAQIREKTGLMVIAIRKPAAGQEFVFNPVAETEIVAGDELIVLGQPDQIERLRRYAGQS